MLVLSLTVTVYRLQMQEKHRAVQEPRAWPTTQRPVYEIRAGVSPGRDRGAQWAKRQSRLSCPESRMAPCACGITSEIEHLPGGSLCWGCTNISRQILLKTPNDLYVRVCYSPFPERKRPFLTQQCPRWGGGQGWDGV